MKVGHVLAIGLLVISLVPYSFQDPSQDTAVATDQDWQEEYQPDEYRGEKEEETDDQTTRRPRGKRRRRMRKRLRPQVADVEVDRVSNVEQNQDAPVEKSHAEDDTVTPDTPRRRPGKRRRRPLRRHPDDDGAPVKPLRRRRKGGRKKIRPENQDVEAQTDGPQEQRNVETPPETTTVPVQTTIRNNYKGAALEEENPTVISKVITTTPEPVRKEEPQYPKVTTNVVKTENEDTGKPAVFGSKIFDRKKLFSSPRRTLPVTSAVIRKLGPNRANNTENSTVQPEVKHYETKIIDKALIKLNSVPESNTNQPVVIKPEKLVNAESQLQKVKKQEAEDEEPNYPKFIPKPINRIRYKPIETTTIQYTTTEKIETTGEPEKQTETYVLQDSPMTPSEFERMLDNLDVGNLNLTHINDYILDLLKSKTGKEHLAKILESRNMTVTQLLEHRERGSSKFHLLEMFPQRKKQQESQLSSTTAKVTTSATSATTEALKDAKEIQFPSEDVLGSFPKFVSDEIEKHEQKNQIINETESENGKDNREPRLFDSMPEFTTLSVTSTTKSEKHPTWRIIPNPKLRPVSVRGNYEEIPISNILNRPLENDVNDIYIVDERDSTIHHKKFGSERKTKETFGNFKKIPVGVKSAIIISGIILAVATFGFLSLLISCRVRQKRTLLRAKQDMMCEQLQNDDFMTSQQSLNPVLTKHQQVYNPHHEHHSHPHYRHHYLWRTIRRTFRYE